MVNAFINKLKKIVGGWSSTTSKSNASPSAAKQAFGSILTPLEVAEDQIEFTPVSPEGTFTPRREAWAREQGTKKSTITEKLVVTRSGSINETKKLRVQCQFCAGFDDLENPFCDGCGLGMCRAHLRPFQNFRLCPRCTEVARFHANTWGGQQK